MRVIMVMAKTSLKLNISGGSFVVVVAIA